MRFKKFASVSCSLFLAAALAFGSAGAVNRVQAADSVAALKSQLDDLQKQSNAIDSEISSLKNDKAKQEELKAQYQKKIDNTSEQIRICTTEIASLSSEISAKSADIEAKNIGLEENKALFKQRLRAMYMSGSLSSLIVLADSESFSDYLIKSELTRSVSRHDGELMQKIIDAVKEIEADKAEMESKKQAQLEVKKTLAEKQKELQSQLSESNAVIAAISNQTAALSEKQADTEADISVYEEKIKEAEEAIKKAEEEARRQAEEARRKAEEARKNGDPPAGGQPSGGQFSSDSFLWPVNGFYAISSPFGMRVNPVSGVYKLHAGIDIAGSGIAGKPILAAADGTVSIAKFNDGGYGYYVLLTHGIGDDDKFYSTLYGHMTNYIVSVGQTVKKGQVIGYVGKTGGTTGYHLHFEIRVDGTPVNPLNYFSKN